jgi:hypothetical protein
MFAERIIVFLALCCIVVSVPVSYLVNTYRMTNSINPSDNLTSFIKYLPFLILSIVLFYGAYDATKLVNNNKTKDAVKLAIILIVLLVAAFVVATLTFNIGIRYVM